MRKTKIVCTIGPASESEEMLEKLIKAGMDVARFNFSHGSHEEQGAKYERLINVRKKLKLPVATLLDTKGPEIRLRDFKNGKEELTKGQKFTLTTKDIPGDNKIVSITYANLPNDVKVGGTILIDDGLIELKIDEIKGEDIFCTVLNGGKVSNRKGVNVPGANLTMPFISEQDRKDIIFGCQKGFNYIALSFTRTAADVLEVRKILDEQRAKIKIIAKIENMQGINNLDEILAVSDGIMVARGDLGVEVPLEQIPMLQKTMIKKGEVAGKIVITATQMLESMINNPRPTRAETTDVANAIYDGTSAIMLSGESAAGNYPAEAVATMSKIAEVTEKDIDYASRMKLRLANEQKSDITTAVSHATCTMAEDIKADAIITVSLSGLTASRLSKYKPICPIIACSTSVNVACQMNLMFDVTPLIIGTEDNADKLFDAAINQALSAGLVKAGDTVILTAGMPLGISGHTNMIKVMEVW